jgi:heme exporter protein A
MSKKLLSFEQVSLARGGRLLFSRLDLGLLAGDALQVAGSNGSGKSSSIRLAAGLLRPTEGRVQAASLALSDERLALDRELSLKKALVFWNRLHDPQPVDAVLEQFRLSHLADVPVRMLSTGQAKRSSLARVAASPARLWLLDEPLNGLDDEGAECLAAAIARHRSSGGAVLAASHVALPGQWARVELGA